MKISRKHLRAVLGFMAMALHVSLLGATAPAAEQAPLTLEVDLRDLARDLVHATLRIPAAPGPMTLVYPKWGPGDHSPMPHLSEIQDLHFMAGGKDLPWRRDGLDPYAFHLELPPHSKGLEARFDWVHRNNGWVFLVPWAAMVFHPAGPATDRIKVQASFQAPPGWVCTCALDLAPGTDGRVTLPTTDLTTLVDSPLVLGTHRTVLDLGAPDGLRHRMDLYGETEAPLPLDPSILPNLRRLPIEAGLLFGSRHFQHYDWIVSLGRALGGLEHHQCSQDQALPSALAPGAVHNPAYQIFAYMVPHEYVHSWNGKYRRPLGLATPDFQQTMDGRMLWVYEGLTQYLGYVLAARSGLLTPEQTRDAFAVMAAGASQGRWRLWRSLEDTTFYPVAPTEPGRPWAQAYGKDEFYNEGAFLWLEIDARIRTASAGARSLDDFCRSFFAGPNRGPEVLPYGIEEIVQALDGVQPANWSRFLEERVQGVPAPDPAIALAAAGWRMAWEPLPTAAETAFEEGTWGTPVLNALYGFGARINLAGEAEEVRMDSPADLAGLQAGMTLTRVEGAPFTLEAMRKALTERRPFHLEAARSGRSLTLNVAYADGQKYPVLRRALAEADLLAAILRPCAPQ